MAASLTGVSVYLTPGMLVKITCPVNSKNANGYFPRQIPLPSSIIRDMPEPSDLIRGFIVEDEKIGTIGISSEDELSIIYKHKQPYGNVIWFFANTGERGIVNVISVPIHDHSSIVHGGPAYGTYFDDDVER